MRGTDTTWDARGPAAKAGTDNDPTIAARSDEVDPVRQGMLRSVLIGLMSVPIALAFVSIAVSFNAYDASWWWVPAFSVPGAALLAFYGVLLRRPLSQSRLALLELTGYSSFALVTSLGAVRLGGLESPYIVAIAMIVLARGALIPTHWKRAALTAILCTLGPVVVLVSAAWWDPGVCAQWSSARSTAFFGISVIFMAIGCGITAYGSHVTWAAKRQVREARKLGSYRLKAQIGRGGMGEVWLAWDAQLRRDVALKLLRAEGPDRRSLSARFVREARSLCRLESRYAVRVYDFGASDDGIMYIVMELLRGEDLAAYVAREGRLKPAEAARFARQAARALQEAHSHGIVHRDVKPANMFMSEGDDGQRMLKLIDFGLAKVEDPGATTLTMVGCVPGTPVFMAPEQCRGDRVDGRTDIYSLGASMYFLVTGQCYAAV